MGLFGRREPDPLDGIDLGLGKGDAVLASCVDAVTGERLVASTHHLSVVGADGALRLGRPWHLVDTGSYDNEADVLTATWVDRAPDLMMHVAGDRPFLQTFRERVHATVIIAEQIDFSGTRHARVVIRKNLAENRLLDQVILGPGVRLAAPGVRERIEVVRAALREQVGLP